MRNRLVSLVLGFCLMGLLALSSHAELAVGIGYPYLSVKYDFLPSAGAELKYAFAEEISVIAGRGYWTFYQTGPLYAFTGLEIGGIFFKVDDIQGNGLECGLFLGGEYRITDWLGISLEIVPTLIQVTAQNNYINGVEWVVNAGLYWYVL